MFAQDTVQRQALKMARFVGNANGSPYETLGASPIMAPCLLSFTSISSTLHPYHELQDGCSPTLRDRGWRPLRTPHHHQFLLARMDGCTELRHLDPAAYHISFFSVSPRFHRTVVSSRSRTPHKPDPHQHLLQRLSYRVNRSGKYSDERSVSEQYGPPLLWAASELLGWGARDLDPHRSKSSWICSRCLSLTLDSARDLEPGGSPGLYEIIVCIRCTLPTQHEAD